MIYALWLLVTCLPTGVGCTPLLHSGPLLRELGTYRTQQACLTAARLTDMGMGKAAGGATFCVPTLPSKR